MSVNISDNFSVEDIHKIREENFEKTKGMSVNELLEYYSAIGEDAKKQIQNCRKVLRKKKTA